MRLLEKYRSIETATRANRERYSRKSEEYCFFREQKAKGSWPIGSRERAYYLFWLNVHYVYGLMRERGSQDSLLP